MDKLIQDDYRKLYSKETGWIDSVEIYRQKVSSLITGETVVLEAGVGFNNMFKDEYKKAKKVIGVDIEEEYVMGNVLLDEKIVSDLASIPQVANESVDLIISSWVLEHVEKPQEVFNEFSRVLKPGGKIVFLTPNYLNYVVFANSLAPKWLRMFFVSRISEDLTVDPMPVYYRANTKSQITKLAKKSDLKIDKLIFNGDPTYIAINKFVFGIGKMIERIQNIPFLNRFRVHIIGILEKG